MTDPRDALAAIIYESSGYGGRPCATPWIVSGYQDETLRQADAIIAAGWVPTPAHNETGNGESTQDHWMQATRDARAELAGVRFRVEVACEGYANLMESDVPLAHDVHDYIEGAHDAAVDIRAALAAPTGPTAEGETL